MFGVVLWSDRQEHKAVIWCEDHGELAFYRRSGNDGQVSLDAGDWVQFDLTTDSNRRLAHNPRLVAEGLYAGLAEVLGRSSTAADGATRPPKPAGPATAEVLPFRRRGPSERSDAACYA